MKAEPIDFEPLHLVDDDQHVVLCPESGNELDESRVEVQTPGALRGARHDGALLQLALGGDSAAFTVIYRRYSPGLSRRASRLLGDPHAAEDVVQETFLRAFTHGDTFDRERNLGPWLTAIAVRLCIDQLRRRQNLNRLLALTHSSFGETASDQTFEAANARENWTRLMKAISDLPTRQRRALMQSVIAGQTNEEIASADGTTVDTVKSLAKRARGTLRKALGGTLPLVLAAKFSRLRRRAVQAASRMKVSLSSGLPEVSLSVAAQSISTGLVVLALLAASLVGNEATPNPGRPSTSSHRSTFVSQQPNWRSTGGIGSQTRGTLAEPILGAAGAIPKAPLPWRKNPTPESTRFTSIVPSPNYHQDHTIFAVGVMNSEPCPKVLCSLLFRSHDGGATWNLVAAAYLDADTLLLPPAYPADASIFAIGESGLQESVDGGETFMTVVPIPGDAAISPNFDNGDDRIVIAAGIPIDYLASKGVAIPSTLPVVQSAFSVAFSPESQRRRPVLFLGSTMSISASEPMRSVIRTCIASSCRSMVAPEGSGAPRFAFSPEYAQDHTVYAFTKDALLISSDMKSFEAIALPPETRGALQDVEISAGPGLPSLFLAVAGKDSVSGVYRSDDVGRTWIRTTIPVRGFGSGMTVIVATSDGRSFVAGSERGLACSEDGGRSWSTRCTPSEAPEGIKNGLPVRCLKDVRGRSLCDEVPRGFSYLGQP